MLKDYSTALNYVNYVKKSIDLHKSGGYSTYAAHAFDSLGVALQGLGRTDEARDVYEKSLKIYDLFDSQEDMKRARERLDGLAKES